MALTGIDKVKINRYLKEHANGDIYYLDMCDYLGKRGKISDIEFLEHFTDCVVAEFSKDVKISIKLPTIDIILAACFNDIFPSFENSAITQSVK